MGAHLTPETLNNHNINPNFNKMKKFLLFAAATVAAVSASAAEAVLAETDFATASSYNFWKSDVTNAEIKDGGLTITNETAAENFWDIQYMVADNFTLVGGTEYTVDVKIKGFSGTLHYNLGTWGSNVGGDASVETSSDWQNVVFKVTAKEDTDGTAHLLLQSGEFVGSYTVASVKITYNEEGGNDTPVEGGKNILKAFYDGNGATLGGWGGTFENVEEDGKPCIKVTVESELENDWNCQMAMDYDFEPGTTYYIDMEVKGTVDGSIGSGLQNSTTYAGGGNFNPFNITKEWNKQTIECTATAAGDGLPNRWTANFGKYVGSAWITNVVLYTLSEGAVETIAPVKVNTAVYNLQGVKVADSLDEVAVPGLYISNGKKIIKK